MSELSTLLFGLPQREKPTKTNGQDQLVRLIFGKQLLTLDKRDLGVIAARMLWRIEYYYETPGMKKSRNELISLAIEHIEDVQKTHPITGHPMIQHRHFGNELDRLLLLAHEIKVVIQSKAITDDLKRSIRELARQSELAATAIESTNRTRQADWVDPVINRANELAQKRPKPNTSHIAELIAADAIANKTGKTASAIRKVLNKCKIR